MNAETDIVPSTSPSHERLARSRRSPARAYLRGAALIFDFAGTLSRRQTSTVRHRTDADALAADWYAVGGDLRRAMGLHPSDRSSQ